MAEILGKLILLGAVGGIFVWTSGMLQDSLANYVPQHACLANGTDHPLKTYVQYNFGDGMEEFNKKFNGFMCIITHFFVEGRKEAVKTQEGLLWEAVLFPLLDMFISIFVLLVSYLRILKPPNTNPLQKGVDATRFGPKILPLIHWGALFVAAFGYCSQFFGVSLAIPGLYVGPFILVDVIWSLISQDRRLPPIGRVSQIRGVTSAAFLFAVTCYLFTNGPIWLMKETTHVFQFLPLFAPLFFTYPGSLLFGFGGKKESPDPAVRRQAKSAYVVHIYKFFAGFFAMHHILILLNTVPFLFPNSTANPLVPLKELWSTLVSLLTQPGSSFAHSMLPVRFLWVETVSVTASVLVWILSHRSKGLGSAIGVVLGYIIVVPLLGVGSALMFAAASREKELGAEAVLVSTTKITASGSSGTASAASTPSKKKKKVA
ncbi:hypothetical protein HDU97_001340 [Phlyctochytrium planicorne]|nr:hypothetical protein HDU97_001340 [Phlyctochytrium planicorne]